MTQNRSTVIKRTDRANQWKCLSMVSALALAGLLVGCPPEATLEQACLDSGGTVVTRACNCQGTAGFYNTCEVEPPGFCLCPPEYPEFDLSFCDCGEGQCFDGTTCVPE